MANLTSVHVTAGIPDSGTGDVSTIDALLAQLSALYTTTQAIAAGAQLVTLVNDVVVPVAGFVAHDAADSGNPLKLGGYAKAAAPSDVSADADRVNAWFLRNGAQACVLTAAGALIGGDATNGLDVDAGIIAHDAADAGNPVKLGFKATTALSGLTLVADADRTNGFAGVDGVQIVRPHANLEDIVTGNATNTDGASTQCIAAQSAGIKTYLTSIILCNTSATAITVDIKDGTTVKVSLPLPAGSGCVFNPPVPIPGTAATAWNFDGSAAATTVTCSMVGFKSKV